MFPVSRPAWAALAALLAAGPAAAQTRPGGTNPLDALRARMGAATTAAAPGKLKKYDEVITKDAKTLPGVFTVHRIDDKLYFEIPEEGFDKLMLWQAEVAKGPAGVSWGGKALGSAVVKWERRGNKVYLWKVGFAKRADDPGTKLSLDSGSQDTIIAAFPVEAEGKDRTAVVPVTPLFTTDMADLSVKQAVGGAAGVDDSRSYLSDVKAFPTNVEVRSLLTFRGATGAFGGPSRGPVPSPLGDGGRSMTALVHYSLVQLPDQPMRGRYADPRVGYFTEGFDKYDDPRGWSAKRQFVTRYRLEKKDPAAAVSEPVKPITFYVGREVPAKWRSYIKKGVEDWAPAFEAAGFKNAIVCKDAPEPTRDPSWDAEDARWSVIRWASEPIANAMGPHVHDPRSGEIISSHVVFWHDILKLTQQWYFVQCSAVDERARKLPLPDDLTGELIRYVACHEVGHTLGLRHNHRASQAYTVEQLRDPKFTAENGSVASIMSYGRYNYVAQPGDGVKKLIPVVGPYDTFAIKWGYEPIPGADSSEAERKTLDQWASRQLSEPYLRFGGEDGPAAVDPTVLTENIGNDPVAVTALGLKNLDKVLSHLVAATSEKGEDYSVLEDTYKAVMNHQRNWYGAVAKQVGGVVESRTLPGKEGGEQFARVPAAKQKEAVKFLVENAFQTPKKLLDPKVVGRFRYSGLAADVTGMQATLLKSLLSEERLDRLAEAELSDPAGAYTGVALAADLSAGVWSELLADKPKVDPVRRALQREFVDILTGALEPPAAAGAGSTPSPFGATRRSGGEAKPELRVAARATLQALLPKLEAGAKAAADPATKAHLDDARAEVESALKGGPKGG